LVFRVSQKGFFPFFVHFISVGRMEDVPRAPREDGAPRAPKSVSIYSPNKSKAKKTSSKEPAKLDNDGELERLHKELHSTRAQLTDLEERSLEYRKQAGLLRERMRGSDDKEKSLQTQLDRLLRDSDTMSRKLSDATKLGEEMTADRDKVVQERDTILERSRVATVEAGLERERLQSMQRDALASLEKLGNQLLLLEKEKVNKKTELEKGVLTYDARRRL
jgi:DNA repair exonuclease SbcCD ATPase subunit